MTQSCLQRRERERGGGSERGRGGRKEAIKGGVGVCINRALHEYQAPSDFTNNLSRDKQLQCIYSLLRHNVISKQRVNMISWFGMLQLCLRI